MNEGNSVQWWRRSLFSVVVLVGGYKRAELKDKLKEPPQKGGLAIAGAEWVKT